LLGRSAAALLVLGLVLFGVSEIRNAERRNEEARQETARLQKIQKAQDDVKAFRPLAAETHRLFALQEPGAEQLVSAGAERTERKAEQAVARLKDWGPDLAELPLAAERPALKQQLYEVLLLLAETKTRRGTRRESAREAL